MQIGFIYDQSGGFRAANDCVPRAFAALTGEEYKVIRKDAEGFQGKVKGKRASIADGVSDKAIDALADKYGLKRVNARKPNGKWLTFAEANARYGDCVIRIRGHLTAVIDGNVRDTWDCSRYTWNDEKRERKCLAIWIRADGKPAPYREPTDTRPAAKREKPNRIIRTVRRESRVIHADPKSEYGKQACLTCNQYRFVKVGNANCDPCEDWLSEQDYTWYCGNCKSLKIPETAGDCQTCRWWVSRR